jgi:tRNA(Ile)-lysidine synthase
VLAVEALLAVPGSAQRALSGGVGVIKEYDRVFLVARTGTGAGAWTAGEAPATVPLRLGGSVRWFGGSITAERTVSFHAPEVSREAFVDGAIVNGTLQVRAPRPGDRLRPFGSPGTRKLQDIFVDLRIPARERATWPLVVSGERIVWVCGLVSTEEGRIGPETKEIIRLTWERM